MSDDRESLHPLFSIAFGKLGIPKMKIGPYSNLGSAAPCFRMSPVSVMHMYLHPVQALKTLYQHDIHFNAVSCYPRRQKYNLKYLSTLMD